MNTLIYIPTGLASPELEILLSKAQESIDIGNSTTIVTCYGGPGYACSLNIYGLRQVCGVCKALTKRGIDKLSGSYEHIKTPCRLPVPKLDRNRCRILENRWMLKKYTTAGIDVGQSAYSSYLGLSRDQDLEGFLSTWALNRLLATSEQLSAWFDSLLRHNCIDNVILYNGRHNQYRPLLRVGQQLHLAVEVMEFSGTDSGCVYTFRDELPQDIDVLNRYIEQTWRSFSGNVLEVVDFFYQKKRAGGIINDTKSYVLNQDLGRLPLGWDASKHNIAIFNSSEDEYTALGGDYDDTLYANQANAIAQICDSLRHDMDIVIWLRIHPNLSDVHWSFVQRLYALGRTHSNVRVISAKSPVSSYSLLDACDTVLSFGSTMGVEAVYAHKPSILVGRCVYERLGSVYTPSTHDAVIALLRQRNLPCLPAQGAHKVALFWTVGGHSLHLFAGDRQAGFMFAGKFVKKTTLEWMIYSLAKFFEQFVLNRLINYGLRKHNALSNR